jgi:HTH-type transcriptional regulator/antitoxin HipB
MSITTPSDFGAALRDQRERLGLSQGQLAAKIGTTQGRISRFERGDGATSLRTILTLLAALNLEITIRQREQRDDANEQGDNGEIDLGAIADTGLKTPRRSSER